VVQILSEVVNANRNVTRVTRLGDFSSIGWLFSFSIFLITEVWHFIGLLFMKYKLPNNFDQNWVGLHFGRFLKLVWGRCYDFKNIFAEKFSDIVGVFDSKITLNYAKI
jgi:hypothetical protein